MKRFTGPYDHAVAVSMTDIAQRAGVSASTVSYVLSGKKAVSPERHRRVMQAVRELGYRPHAAARALASKRTSTIALVVPPLGRGLVATQLEFVSAIAEESSERGYDLLLAVSRDERANISRLVAEGVVDGLIVMEVLLDDPRVSLLRDLGVPFVLIGRPADTAGLRFVDANTESMVRRAVEHLHGLGHRGIGLVNLPDSLLTSGYAPAVRARDAYEAACASFGLRPWSTSCDTTVDGTSACVRRLTRERPDVTALVTLNDDAVAGLITALDTAGRPVPDAFSVIAIIGPTRAGQLTQPPLTVIELPTAAMATTATRLLIDALQNTDPPTGTLFDPPITLRNSTAPPPP